MRSACVRVCVIVCMCVCRARAREREREREREGGRERSEGEHKTPRENENKRETNRLLGSFPSCERGHPGTDPGISEQIVHYTLSLLVSLTYVLAAPVKSLHPDIQLSQARWTK